MLWKNFSKLASIKMSLGRPHAVKELSSLASPLSAEQVDKLKSLSFELNAVQLAWVSGYLAASAQSAAGGRLLQRQLPRKLLR